MPVKKSYCFTLNNYTQDELSHLERSLGSEAEYAIFGKEVGDSGTPHLQGYVLFKRPYRFQTIKDRYLPRCHIEVAAGSLDSNRRYCSKDGDFREFGKAPEPKAGNGEGSRDAIATIFAESCRSGHDGLSEFAGKFPGTFYFSGHNLIRNWLSVQPTIERHSINVRWFHGLPGTGKSRRAHELLPRAFVKEPRTKWWSGYMLEPDVIIDDFGPGGIDINHLLRWFDRYKCSVETKGGMIPLHAVTFIVTSNFTPGEIFKNIKYELCNNVSFPVEGEHPQLSALLRRMSLELFE